VEWKAELTDLSNELWRGGCGDANEEELGVAVSCGAVDREAMFRCSERMGRVRGSWLPSSSVDGWDGWDGACCLPCRSFKVGKLRLNVPTNYVTGFCLVRCQLESGIATGF
jgi:hypothetical protein